MFSVSGLRVNTYCFFHRYADKSKKREAGTIDYGDSAVVLLAYCGLSIVHRKCFCRTAKWICVAHNDIRDELSASHCRCDYGVDGIADIGSAYPLVG